MPEFLREKDLMSRIDKRYESDYETTRQLNAKGKMVSVQKYIGPRYYCGLTAQEKTRKRGQLLLFMGACLFSYLYAATREVAGNSRGLPGALGGLIMVALLFMLIGLLRWCCYPDPLERIQYERSVIYVCYSGAIGAAVGGLNLIAQVVSVITSGEEPELGILTILGYTVTTAMLYFLYRTMKAVPYREEAGSGS